MNGRVYDPLLGRFGTPDPMTESPYSTQGWNRYSYVGNSPVNFTDPSGYCFMGCFWKPIFKAIGNFLQKSWQSLVQLGATTLLCAGAGPFAPLCAGVVAFAVTGITSGDLGLAMRAGITAFATAFAFKVVGDLTGNFAGADPIYGGHGPLEPWSDAHMFNVAGHALVGCGSAVAQGGKCGPGALAAGVTSLAGPWINGRAFSMGRLVANSVLGGVASVAAGGKFVNGAVTAAFGYLFNQTLEGMKSTEKNFVEPRPGLRLQAEEGDEVLAGRALETDQNPKMKLVPDDIPYTESVDGSWEKYYGPPGSNLSEFNEPFPFLVPCPKAGPLACPGIFLFIKGGVAVYVIPELTQ
jgi:hypothetical protein